jgi:dissimilatory sulfite reductase (desulfoviridin) alpha/beta subunit
MDNCFTSDPDLVQAFLKKGRIESDFKASNLPLSLRLKVSGCHYNSIYNNTCTEQVKQLCIRF